MQWLLRLRSGCRRERSKKIFSPKKKPSKLFKHSSIEEYFFVGIVLNKIICCTKRKSFTITPLTNDVTCHYFFTVERDGLFLTRSCNKHVGVFLYRNDLNQQLSLMERCLTKEPPQHDDGPNKNQHHFCGFSLSLKLRLKHQGGEYVHQGGECVRRGVCKEGSVYQGGECVPRRGVCTKEGSVYLGGECVPRRGVCT